MSEYNFYEIFPTSIATALHRAFGSYLVKNGVAVRHPNGFEELLVSYPNLNEDFPDHFDKFFEGFREAVSTVVNEVKDVVEEVIEKVEQATETTSGGETETETKEDTKNEEKDAGDDPNSSKADQDNSTDTTQTDDKPKRGRKPKAAVVDNIPSVASEQTKDEVKDETASQEPAEGDKTGE